MEALMDGRGSLAYPFLVKMCEVILYGESGHYL